MFCTALSLKYVNSTGLTYLYLKMQNAFQMPHYYLNFTGIRLIFIGVPF